MFHYNVKTGDMFLYGVVGESWFDDGIVAKDVAAVLDEMNGKRLNVHINSPGGVADEGIAIYNLLRRYSGGVDTTVDALAASAASVIALAGEERTVYEGGRFMIHQAMSVAIGNSKEMRAVAAILDTYDESLVDIYAKSLVQSRDEIRQMMVDETWFTAAESVEAGLATAVSDTETDQEPDIAAWMEHPPKDIAAKAKRTDGLPRATSRLKIVPAKRELARLRLRLSQLKS